ncbi:unnamed protein product [Caenorhabditis brenneri]
MLNFGSQMDFEKYQQLAPMLGILQECDVQIMDRCNNHGGLLSLSDNDIRSAQAVAFDLRACGELVDDYLRNRSLCEARGLSKLFSKCLNKLLGGIAVSDTSEFRNNSDLH